MKEVNKNSLYLLRSCQTGENVFTVCADGFSCDDILLQSSSLHSFYAALSRVVRPASLALCLKHAEDSSEILRRQHQVKTTLQNYA